MTGTQGMFMRRDYRPADTSWHHQGTCTPQDQHFFYHPENERGSTRRARANAAKAICRECPIRKTCREQSLATREQYGVWGGLSEDERGQLLAGQPIEEMLHDHPRPARYPRKQKEVASELTPLVLGQVTPGRRIRVHDERVTAHVQWLVDTGHTTKQIAETSGLTLQTVNVVAAGRIEVTERTANLLLAVRSGAVAA